MQFYVQIFPIISLFEPNLLFRTNCFFFFAYDLKLRLMVCFVHDFVKLFKKLLLKTKINKNRFSRKFSYKLTINLGHFLKISGNVEFSTCTSFYLIDRKTISNFDKSHAHALVNLKNSLELKKKCVNTTK